MNYSYVYITNNAFGDGLTKVGSCQFYSQYRVRWRTMSPAPVLTPTINLYTHEALVQNCMVNSRLRTSLETNAQLSQSNLQVWKVTTLQKFDYFDLFHQWMFLTCLNECVPLRTLNYQGVILITVPCVLLRIKNLFVCLLVLNTLFLDWTRCWRCERDGGAVPSIKS